MYSYSFAIGFPLCFLHLIQRTSSCIKHAEEGGHPGGRACRDGEREECMESIGKDRWTLALTTAGPPGEARAGPWAARPSPGWGRRWGCTGRTGCPGTGASWSLPLESPIWAPPPPDSQRVHWERRCGTPPSGCGRERQQLEPSLALPSLSPWNINHSYCGFSYSLPFVFT